jgi:hypothetical protein
MQMFFPRYALSSERSNFHANGKLFHTGDIYVIFHLCVFSHEAAKKLLIGKISSSTNKYVALSQYAQPYAGESWLFGRMILYTGHSLKSFRQPFFQCALSYAHSVKFSD